MQVPMADSSPGIDVIYAKGRKNPSERNLVVSIFLEDSKGFQAAIQKHVMRKEALGIFPINFDRDDLVRRPQINVYIEEALYLLNMIKKHAYSNDIEKDVAAKIHTLKDPYFDMYTLDKLFIQSYELEENILYITFSRNHL